MTVTIDIAAKLSINGCIPKNVDTRMQEYYQQRLTGLINDMPEFENTVIDILSAAKKLGKVDEYATEMEIFYEATLKSVGSKYRKMTSADANGVAGARSAQLFFRGISRELGIEYQE